ncbi:MAG: cytochrome c biogenesis protein CcdA [Proteobacteria bacterium]|nr:cytochrome c biogenesis protein CcdA [Pseudomonadota bacterium]
MFVDGVSYHAALLAGLLSFFSPCVLPLIPAYFTFITGLSLEELTEGNPGTNRYRVLWSTCAFVLGFSFVFIIFGASASFLGRLLTDFQDVVRVAGGVIILLLGIHVSGLFRFRILDYEKRLHLNRKPVHFLGTVLVGMAFGAGWSPCVGPLLGSILIIAGSKETIMEGVWLLSVYSAGLAIPFLAIALSIHSLLSFLKKGVRALKYVNAVAGGLLVLVGVLLITDKLRLVG